MWIDEELVSFLMQGVDGSVSRTLCPDLFLGLEDFRGALAQDFHRRAKDSLAKRWKDQKVPRSRHRTKKVSILESRHHRLASLRLSDISLQGQLISVTVPSQEAGCFGGWNNWETSISA